jgi:hypothetical protein
MSSHMADEIMQSRQNYQRKLLAFGVDTGIQMESWLPYVLETANGQAPTRTVCTRMPRGAKLEKLLKRLGLL